MSERRALIANQLRSFVPRDCHLMLIEDSEEYRNFCLLMNSDWVELQTVQYENITWNGFHIHLPPGRNIVPMPFWVVWRQTQVDVEQGQRDLAKDIEAAMRRKGLGGAPIQTDPSSAAVLTVKKKGFTAAELRVEMKKLREANRSENDGTS